MVAPIVFRAPSGNEPVRGKQRKRKREKENGCDSLAEEFLLVIVQHDRILLSIFGFEEDAQGE